MITLSPGRPAVFFDRDGTLMREVNYCRDPSLVETPPGLREALADLRRAGFLRVIVTNQSGIARGLITLPEYESVQAELARQLGGEIDASYMCPDHPDTPSNRRKPAPGMLLEAARDLNIALDRSYIVGDKMADIEAGAQANLRASLLVLTGHGREESRRCPPTVPRFEDAIQAIRSILSGTLPPTPDPSAAYAPSDKS